MSRPRLETQHPLQSQWPPSYVGIIPNPETPFLRLHLPELPWIGNLYHPEDNPLYSIWCATCERIGDYEFLVLPAFKDGQSCKWRDISNHKYSSNKLLIRKAYKDHFSIFHDAAQKNKGECTHMTLSGMPGTGKSFFYRYMIWRLLHPSKKETHFPNAILLCPDSGSKNGYLYHRGSFYSVINVGDFLGTNLAASMFNHRNAWIICDGNRPPSYMHCPTLLIGHFEYNDPKDLKKYHHGVDCELNTYDWTLGEIKAIAGDCHGIQGIRDFGYNDTNRLQDIDALRFMFLDRIKTV